MNRFKEGLITLATLAILLGIDSCKVEQNQAGDAGNVSAPNGSQPSTLKVAAQDTLAPGIFCGAYIQQNQTPDSDGKISTDAVTITRDSNGNLMLSYYPANSAPSRPSFQTTATAATSVSTADNTVSITFKGASGGVLSTTAYLSHGAEVGDGTFTAPGQNSVSVACYGTTP